MDLDLNYILFIIIVGIVLFGGFFIFVKMLFGKSINSEQKLGHSNFDDKLYSPILSDSKIFGTINHDVIISYSTHDKAVADAVCAGLEAKKITCWIAPRDILPGTNYQESIVDAIDSSKIMVLIFSANSNDSSHVLSELTRAINKKVIIIPFRIEDVVPSKSIEYLISIPHWLDAMTPPLEKHIRELEETVKILIEKKRVREKDQ